MAYKGVVSSGNQGRQLELKAGELLSLKPGETLVLPSGFRRKSIEGMEATYPHGQLVLVDQEGNTYFIDEAPGSKVLVASVGTVDASLLPASASSTANTVPADQELKTIPVDSQRWEQDNADGQSHAVAAIIGSLVAIGAASIALAGDGSDHKTPGAPAPVPQAPVITSNGGGSNAAISVAEGDQLVTTVHATDADSSSISYSLAGGADAARFTIDGVTGALRFIVPPDFEHPGDVGGDNVYQVIVRASDGERSDTQTLLVTVGNVVEPPVNHAPIYDDAVRNAAENSPQGTVVGPTVQASDPDGDVLSYAIVGGNNDGAFAIDAQTGVITVADASKLDFETQPFIVLTVQATDPGGQQDTATVKVNLIDLNEAPIGVADSYSVLQETPLVLPVAAGIFANDGDVDGDSLSPVLITSPAHGSLGLQPDGSFVYTPDYGYRGTDSFVYRANDGFLLSADTTVSITVIPVNHAPVSAADSYTTSEDVALTIPATGVLANDSDRDGDAFTAILVSGPSQGSLVFNADGSFFYTPMANANGTDSFSYKASDGTLDGAVTAVSIHVTPVNDAPVITSDGGDDKASIGIDENTLTATTVIATDADSETSLIYSINGGADAAQFSIDVNTGVLSFISAPDHENPADSDGDNSYDVVVQVSDGVLTDTQALTINVSNVNETPPLAAADSYSIAEDTSLVVAVAGGVLSNDSDADGDALSAVLVSGPTNGSLSLNADGSFNYTPNANYNGSDGFSYKANDGDFNSTPVTVSITVSSVNDAPTAIALGNQSIDENAAAATVVGTLSTTDVDTDDTFTYTLTNDAGGRFQIVGNQLLATGNGLDFEDQSSHAVSVKVQDAAGASFDQSFTIQVKDLNEAPTITNGQSFTVNENSANGTAVGSVLATDPDSVAPANQLSYSIESGNTDNAFAIDSSTGAITVADGSKLDFETTRSYSLVVKAADGGSPGLSDTSTVVVNIGNLAESVSLVELASLDGSKGFTLRGVDGGDQSGRVVSAAGDFNGDGFDDLIIGAPYAEGSVAGKDNQGESYVVYGKAGGYPSVLELSALDGSNGFVLRGTDLNDFSGFSVSGAGDVNGDGLDDLIIGAVFADGGVAGKEFQGESYVVYGKSSGVPAVLDLSSLDGTKGFTLRGVDSVDGSGFSVSGAGDINGDGYDDLIIGAPFAESGAPGSDSQGESYVVYGKAGGIPAVLDLATLDGSQGFVLRGIQGADSSGIAVSGAGDINGDGYDDLIVGASAAEGSAPGFDDQGESYVVYGKASGLPALLDLSTLNGSNGFTLRGVDGADQSGSAVSSAGDVNGDGYDDLIVSARVASDGIAGHELQGESYVVYGKASGLPAVLDLATLDGSNGFVLRGADGGDQSGTSVSSAGDINGDGYDDLIIGAVFADGEAPGKEFQGESYVVYGKASGIPAVVDLASLDGSNGFVLRGVDGGDFSGISVSGAGDVNGDGFDDLIIGAPNAEGGATGKDDQGESYVVFGGYFTGAQALIGTAGDDTLVGTAAGETLNGGNGNDILFGGSGNDVLIGAEGNDILVYDAADTLRVDGGNGLDVLLLLGGESIDFTARSNALITNIEFINAKNGIDGNVIKIDLLDLLDLSSSSNDLFIVRDGGDTVLIGGGLTDSGTDFNDGSVIYDIYTAAGTDARLFVEQVAP